MSAFSERRKAVVQPFTPPTPPETPIPHSPEVEEALLGALLIDRDAVVKVAGLVSPEDFFGEERANLYRALCALYQVREPGDMITIRDQLKRMNLLGEGEGQVKLSYLVRMMNQTPTAVHVVYYAERVRGYSALRKIIRLGAEASALGFQLEQVPGEAMSAIGGQLQELMNWWRKGQDAEYFLAHEATPDLVEQLGEPRATTTPEGQDGRVRLRFGFVCLDGQDPTDPWEMNGVEPNMLLLRSTLTAIAADTSVGKTILAEQIAEANAVAGAKVLFFHNELSHEQMIWRRNTRSTGVPVWRQAERERLNQMEFVSLAKAADEVRNWSGRIDYVFCPNWTAADIAEEAKMRHMALAAGTGSGYDLIVCDYLQNMAMEEGHGTRAEKVARSVHVMHNLANELGVAVIFTSQLTRDGNRDEGFIKPTLHGGLDSGSIERHSNQVLGLWREGRRTELICLKSTFGRRGWSQDLEFVESRLKFIE